MVTIRLFAIRNIVLAGVARELLSDPALSVRRPLLDERRYRATLVTSNPLELRPGAGVENETERATWCRFRFSDDARASSPASRHW